MDCFLVVLGGKIGLLNFTQEYIIEQTPSRHQGKCIIKIFLMKERYLNWLDLSWLSPIDDIFGTVAWQVLICTTQISFMYFLDIPKSVALDFLDKFKNGKTKKNSVHF
jgi:hypothetical protein